MDAFIVVKKWPCTVQEGKQTMKTEMSFNEGVFATESLAKHYVDQRVKHKDPKDRGCRFDIEPWVMIDEDYMAEHGI